MNQINSYFSSLIVITIVVAGLISIENYVFAQTQTGSTGSNTTNYSQSQIEQLNKTMAELESSNNPQDIATLAYIWGYPLVSEVRLVDYSTSPNVPAAPGRGPINTFNNFQSFPTSNFTDIVRINVDTLYSFGISRLRERTCRSSSPSYIWKVLYAAVYRCVHQ